MFYYHFLWCVGTHNFPVNYWNPRLYKETNRLALQAFIRSKKTIMFDMEKDLPYND